MDKETVGAGIVAPGRGEHAAIFTAGGLGLSIACTTRPADFAQADKEAFEPLIASVAFRPGG